MGFFLQLLPIPYITAESKRLNFQYIGVKLWLPICQDIEVSYPTLHRTVRYELNGKPKVPCPTHEK